MKTDFHVVLGSDYVGYKNSFGPDQRYITKKAYTGALLVERTKMDLDLRNQSDYSSWIFEEQENKIIYSINNITPDVEFNSTVWNQTLNTTEEYPNSDWILKVTGDIVVGVVLGFLCLLTTVGNAMVLHAVRTERALQTVSNMYIVSLALADLTVGLIVMPISAIYIFTQEWLFGVVVCQFWIGVDYTASTASIFNLFILSLDRYWSVTSPLRYLRKRTKRRALIMITSVWFVSSLWLIPIIGWHHFEHQGIRTVPSNVCDTEYATNTALKIITGLLNFYLPLAIMYGLYTKIFLEIKKRSKLEVGQKNRGGSYRKQTKEPFSMSASNDTQDSDPCGLSPNTKQSVITAKAHALNRIDQVEKTSVQNRDASSTLPDEETPLNNKPYLRSLLCAKQAEISADSDTSECDPRASYSYDEVVIDPTTEKLHRYCFEDNPRKLVSNKNQIIYKKPPPELFLDLKETCFCSSESSLSIEHVNEPVGGNKQNEENKIWLQTKQTPTRFSHVQLILPDNQDASETQHKYPKEYHPAKNHYIKSQYLLPISSPQTSPVRDALLQSTRPSSAIMHYSRSPPSPYRKRPKSFPHCERRSENISNNSNNNGFLNVNQPSPTSSLMRRIRQTLRNRGERTANSLQKEIKAARQLGVIMSAFTLCFLPYFVCFMVVAFCESCVSTDLTTTVTWIGYLNSTLNPFLYPLCNATFRRKFRKMLHIGPKDKRQSYYLGAINRGSTIRKR